MLEITSKYGHLNRNWFDAVINKMGGEEGANAFLRGEFILTPVAKAVASAILIMVGTITISATNENFVAEDKFVKNINDSSKVKIYDVSSNFEGWFIKKVEVPFVGGELKYQKLSKGMKDLDIVTEIGGEQKAETSLTEVYSLMEKQPNGESGALLTDGYANIFYCREVKGVLCTVDVYWCGDGWVVYSDSVGRPSEWPGGNQVFSRNSVTI